MQINNANNPDFTFISKAGSANIRHVFIVNENLAVTQDLSAVGRIRDNTNTIIADNIAVSVSKISRLVSDEVTAGQSVIYVELNSDVYANVITLPSGVRYKFEFVISYSENGSVIKSFSVYYSFELTESPAVSETYAADTDFITPEILNAKYAGIVSPGVIHGLDIIQGSGDNMYNLKAGEAMTSSGIKLKLSSENHNIIKAFFKPSEGTRVDAVVLTDAGAAGIVPGITNMGVPNVNEANQTVIGFMIFSDSEPLPRIVKRMSADKAINQPKQRIFNFFPAASVGNTDLHIPHDIIPESVAVYKNKRRLFPTEYSVIRGAASIVRLAAAPVVNDAFLVDFDITKKQMPDLNDLYAEIMPVPEAYPWSGAAAVFNNAFVNASHFNNIVSDWDNSGYLASGAEFVLAKLSPLAPDALLNNNGVKLPLDDANKLNGNIYMPSITKKPHTFLIALSFEAIRDAMIINSNSVEPGPLSNFGLSMLASPGPAKLILSHGGLTVEDFVHISPNTKYVFTYKLDASNNVKIFVNGVLLLGTSAASVSYINNLSEIYLKNEAQPTIYYASYWEEAISDTRIAEISNAILNQQLI
ncbi:MAG: hypothetical protein BWY14_01295 [Parcubacteria group bacterium ADurb.Bin192]|nr:MAG: hypothetical protein BWY14_01295 [Parcubacteria group bacterium ADurb.Bin192]